MFLTSTQRAWVDAAFAAKSERRQRKVQLRRRYAAQLIPTQHAHLSLLLIPARSAPPSPLNRSGDQHVRRDVARDRHHSVRRPRAAASPHRSVGTFEWVKLGLRIIALIWGFVVFFFR